jgi:hypothetical protein
LIPTLKGVMQAVADYYGSPLVEDNGVYSLEVVIGDGDRTQVVHGTVQSDRFGRDVFLVFTRVGEWSDVMNAEGLLELNLTAPYVKAAKFGGNLIACGDQLLETCQVEEVVNLVEEVASFGDFLEEAIFGDDSN